MKIAYFTNTYPRATDTFIRLEVLGLRQRGFEVNTYSVRKSGDEHDIDDEVINEKKNTSYILPVTAKEIIYVLLKLVLKPVRLFKALVITFSTLRPGLKGFILQMAYFLEAMVLADRLQRDGIEHIHNHLGDNSGTVTLIASKLSNIPYSISIHGPHIFFDGMYWSLNEKTKHSKFIACIGYFCRSQMMLYTAPENWGKFEIIRCGVDLEKYTLRTNEAYSGTILFVGRLSEEKGVNVLIDSLALLKSQHIKFKLTILGDGPSRENLEQQINRLQLNDSVELLGYVDQVTIREHLSMTDIFILPSFAEGIPVSLMEAMATGVPVITTHVGGISELVIDQQTGLLCYPSDPIGLANAIKTYISDASFKQEVISRSRMHVETAFNVDQQIDKLAKLLRQ